MSNESEICAVLRNDRRAVAFLARHELRGDIGHHTGRDMGMCQHLILHIQHSKMVQHLFNDLISCALRHRLFDIAANTLSKQAISPQNVTVLLPLIREIVPIINDQRHFPTGIHEGDSAARTALASGHLLQSFKKFGIVFYGEEKTHPFGLVDMA